MNNFMRGKTLNYVRKSIKYLLIALLSVCFIFVVRFIFISNVSELNPMFTDGELEIHMVDVGQGDCFIFLQNNKVMLVDCGTKGYLSKAYNKLQSLGVKKIDYVVISHFHQDHSAGLYKILHNYKVEKMIVTDMSTKSLPLYNHLFYYSINSYIALKDLCYFGDMVEYAKTDGGFKDFNFADSNVKFYAPVKDAYEIFNNYSLVMKVSYKDFDILMTGDMESEVEEELLEKFGDTDELQVEVYKAAHHGSKTSNTEDFLRMVDPKIVLLSSHNGDDNRYGHPVKAFVEYLDENHIKLYRTDEQGDVFMVTDGSKVYVDKLKADYISGQQIVNKELNERN